MTSLFKHISNSRLYSWICVVLCTVLIYLTVPLARTIQRFVYTHWGRQVFLYFVLAALGTGLLSLLFVLIVKLRRRSLSNYVWLAVIAGLYLHFSLQLKDIPEEAVHFLEYGLLSFCLYLLLKHYIRDKSLYLTATLWAFSIGTVDEILQWITPDRYWDFRDAGLNGLSGGLFQLALLTVVQPSVISDRFRPRSFRLLAAALIACLILLGLCVSNTPQRVQAYTEKWPVLSSLRRQEPMSEFGFKIEDPDIGVFKSRLRPESLARIDAERAEEYARRLNGTVHMNYNRFLEVYNPGAFPFLHEMRVHLFRRDRYFLEASKSTEEETKKSSYFIAYKENLILEKYFTQTLNASVYRWKDEKRQQAGRRIDAAAFYESPVSANLFTLFTETQLWGLIFTLTAVLATGALIFTRVDKPRQVQSGDRD